MRYRALRSVVAAAVLVGVTGPAASAAPPAAARPARETLAVRAGMRCRTSTVSIGTSLTAAGTVCIRYLRGEWQGEGQVRLTATAGSVTGYLLFSDMTVPIPPGTYDLVQNKQAFAVRPGHPVTLSVRYARDAVTTDRELASTALVVIDPQPSLRPREVPFSAFLNSPAISRTRSPEAVPRRPTGAGAAACAVRPVQDAGPDQVSGSARICLRQVGGRVGADQVRLQYRAPAPTGVSVTLLVDGREAAMTSLPLPASTAPGGRVVVLPTLWTQALRRDATASVRVLVGRIPSGALGSGPVRLRG